VTLDEEGVGALLVTQGGRILGIVSERDIVRAVAESLPLDEPVENVMAPDPFCVGPDASVDEAAAIMGEKSIRHLPVVSADGDFLGVISVRDLLGAAVQQAAGGQAPGWVRTLVPDAGS
jgi:CBS domain-containing protein